eukprot:CAMPEP_0174974460 /NCGR_PEP_ID=MMETSP0004_2-20121128/11853_1 /TAXON_ID=420556 /ORGANISM="Ochromonas sp., Strain CCMP1393" /LENGTH=298 /DNA_ID=CAMNT_0016225109 /DNA_START=183 /DNA_END=1079 /DNA_ORIENTATION=-
MLGTSFLFADPDGMSDISSEVFLNAVYISCISFVLMIGVEHCTSTSMYDYAAVSDSEFLKASSRSNGDLEMVENEIILETAQDGSGSGIGSRSEFRDVSLVDEQDDTDIINAMRETLDEKSFKFYPFILLLSASASDILTGLHFSCQEHGTVAILLTMALHKSLMACTFGTMLESSTAPRSIFLYFMFTYSLSSPVGIITGTMLSDNGFVSAQLTNSLKYTDLIITALAAGVYLYTATIRMIPNSLLSHHPDDESNSTSSSSHSRQSSIAHGKPLRFASFVLGCVVTAVPTVIVSNTS